MGDRFVVVPVDGGVAAPAGQEPSDAVVAPVNSGTAAGGRREAAETSEAPPQDRDGALTILEYNREPNKYGRRGQEKRLVRPVHRSATLNQESDLNFPEVSVKLKHLFQFLFIFYL